MATTLKLPYARFVRQVSTGAPRPKSTYLALMAENLEALKTAEWRAAPTDGVALVPHDFTRTTFFSDAYDAFKMTGNYSAGSLTEVAYAGMAAYRFTLPEDYVEGSQTLVSIALPVTRDRFSRKGVRVVAALSDDAAPSAEWDTVRGEGSGTAATAVLTQASVANLLASSAASETVEIDLQGADATKRDYLWLYVSLEDYEDRWEMYSTKEARAYAVEGSGMIVAEAAEVEFSADVTPDAAATTLLSGGSSPTWIQPLPTQNAGATSASISSSDTVDLFFEHATGSPVPAENFIFLSFPTNEAQRDSGPSAYTGKIRVTINGAAVTMARCTLMADVSPNPDQWSAMTASSPDSAGFVTWSWTVGDGDLQPGEEYRGLSVKLKIAGVQGYQYQLVIGGLFYTHSVAHVSTTGASNFTTYSYNLDGDATFTAFSIATFWLMLRFSSITVNGEDAVVDFAISDADRCDQPDSETRRNATKTLEEVNTSNNSPWNVTVAGVAYYVWMTGARKINVSVLSGGTLGSSDLWIHYFNPAATIWRDNAAMIKYGVSATLGDFSHAVVAYEEGEQPDQVEMLGRLIRNSRRHTGEMLYLHPANGALADELDALRPVPRFYCAASDPTGQTSCQPGLSVWFKRPSSGSVSRGAYAYRNALVQVTNVLNPVFLQYTLLAVRAPAAGEGMSLVMQNVGLSAVVNGFDLRFAVWRSPAEEWDGSNNFALSAIVAAPCLYRTDGADDVSWTVDCGGAAFPFGSRTVHARRLGVSPVVSGDIAANNKIAVQLSGELEDGDVLIIAPVVLGFADGVGAASVYFGRQDDPTDAKTGWARYATDLGWFPKITIEQEA